MTQRKVFTWKGNSIQSSSSSSVRNRNFRLLPGKIYIWAASLKQDENIFHALKNLLDENELRRADGYREKKAGNEFIVSRGILRNLLGYFIGVLPQEIKFGYGPRGKPFLAFPSEQLFFNLSHSRGIVVYAFSRDREPGIDVEYISRFPGMDDIVLGYFSPEEIDAYKRLEGDEKLVSFYNCWTRKEAFLKAEGEGLSKPLNKCAVTFLPAEKAEIIHIDGDYEAGAGWTLHSFIPSEGYSAAIAVNQRDCSFEFRKWEDRLIKEYVL